MESLTSGTLAGTGSFRCEICAHVITMTTADLLPACPGCDGASFTRASLFDGTARFKRPVFGGTARFKQTGPDAPAADGDALLGAARDAIEEAGRYLVFQDAGTVRTVAMTAASMRIGRSLSADLRFEDPTVSRRHAVLVAEAGGVRVLDDRSLNGVFVNGERIVSQTLDDGDEIVIGRYRLRFADRTTEVAAAGARALQAE